MAVRSMGTRESETDDAFFDLTQVGDGTPAQGLAAHAWEIAVCWHAEPDYARSLLPAGPIPDPAQ